MADKEVNNMTDSHLPQDLYELLHSTTFELWSPKNVLSRFDFVFTNVQKILTALSSPNRENHISPNLKYLAAVLSDFLDPGIIPAANLLGFNNGQYDTTVNSMASNYTVSMVLSEQQLLLLNYNVKDLEISSLPNLLGKFERQGRLVKNKISEKQN